MPEGDTTTTATTTTATTTDAGAWTSALPEAIRGHEAWKGVKDVGDLATKYLGYQKPFAEQLPEKIRGEAAFKDIKNLEGLADSYYNAQKLIGVPKDQILRLPADDKPESWAPIYDKLGRPAKPEDYKLTVPQGAPAPEPEFLKSVTTKAHDLGMSAKQLDGMYTWLRETATAQIAKNEAAANSEAAATASALKEKWGAAYNQKLTDATQALDFLESKYPGIKAALDKTGLGNHAGLAEYLADQSTAMREDGKLTGRATGTTSLMSPAEARQSISSLQQDQNFMKSYMDRRAAGHKEAVERMRGLYELAHPSEAA